MKYLLQLRYPPGTGPSEGTPELDAEMAEWGKVHTALEESGALVTAMGLEPDEASTTLRNRNGERVVTDGPYAEAKETLFSFYVIDVADLDAALDWAARMPNAAYGSVEVRPLSPFEQQS